MKRFAYYIACCSLVALFSCTHDDIDEVLAPVGDGKITIQSTLDDMVITRAEVDDTTPERTITHIDIFAIDDNGNIDYYERNVTGNNEGNAENGAGTLTLGVSRRAKDANDNYIFEQGVNYKFILVANAVATKADMQKATTLSDLEKLVQDDSFETSFVGGDSSNEGATGSTPSMSRQTLLHLSGTNQGNNPDKETPKTFLMDAVATDSDNNEKWVVNPANGTVPTLNLSAEFKRAASKIIVNIEQGADVEFRTLLDGESAQYDFYKLPASTFVLPNANKLVNIQLINTAPMQPNTETFIWEYTDASAENPRNENSIQIIGYAYSHSWSDVDLTNETSLILNIPMMWNNDDSDDHSKEAEAPRSWYKVPLSQGKKFERNKCYIVNIEINAVGAATRSTAIELRDIEYKTLDWQDVDINVGDTSENPEYLILNTDLVEMYNVNFDNTSLNFSSSSAITSVTLTDVYKQNADGTFTAETDGYDAYYINKFGNKLLLNSTIRNTISATAEQNVLNGGISILSPIVPATAAEVEKQILEQLGPAPTAPTLTEPTYDGTIPTAPTVVPAAAEPNIEDEEYTKPESITYGNWSKNWYNDNSDWTYNGNNSNQSTSRTRTRTRTNTKTEYNYEKDEDGNYTFLKRTATQKETETQTSTREDRWDNWGEIQSTTESTEWTYSNWTSDTSTQASWEAAVTAYKLYQQYLIDKAKYDADMAALLAKPEYQQYLADKAAYDAALADYNARLADYNEKAAAIRAAAGGEETHYNTIRYLEFEVVNEQGLTATFRVMQYPVIYITNVEGWYSYRDDFVNASYTSPATYEKQNSGIVKVGYSSYNSTTQKVTYTYGTGSSTSGYFWGSKVNTGKVANQNYYNLGYYYWNNSNVTSSTTSSTSLRNARMYYVRVTSTSSDYVVGRPRLVKLDDSGNKVEVAANEVEIGFTDDTEVNAQLVSPSFMLASQLGYFEVSNFGQIPRDVRHIVARDHCKNYVEVTTDGKILNNWRLPTQAEIKIIISLQSSGTNDDSAAIDQVLTATSYYASNGEISASTGEKITGSSSSQPAVRCVRDAY